MALAEHDSTPYPRFSDTAWKMITAPLSALSFWSAIALPAVYLPLLLTGIESTHGLLLFLGLVGLHCLTLVGGQSYRRPTDE